MNRFSRTEFLIGEDNIKKLASKCVAIFGIGGVGSYTVEALARCNIGKLIIIDSDNVDITNINRQIMALTSTIGMPKVQVAKNRILDINPQTIVEAKKMYFDENSEFSFEGIDFIVDAIDCVTSKLLLIEKAKLYNIPIISSMGTGNKLDATKFQIVDITKTKVCPLARVMRKELKERNIKNVMVLYSEEEPAKPDYKYMDLKSKRQVPSSISFVPSVAGLLIAQYVIKSLLCI